MRLGNGLPRPCPLTLIVPFPLLQGRLVQTRKSGCFPSASVKPCPVDGRVSAAGALGPRPLGAALPTAVSWAPSTLHPEKMGGPGAAFPPV